MVNLAEHCGAKMEARSGFRADDPAIEGVRYAAP